MQPFTENDLVRSTPMLRHAAKRAHTSKRCVKHGAIVAKGRRVLGRGCNIDKTSPTWGGGFIQTIHAEAAAIREATSRGINLAGATIYVTRLGTSQMSRPCPTCIQLIIKAGIRQMCYTNKDGQVCIETLSNL